MTSAITFAREVERALRAGVRGVLVPTEEESRALDALEEVGRTLDWPVHTWSSATGVDGDGQPVALGEVLAQCRRAQDDGLWVLCDALPLCDEIALRALRELTQRFHGPAIVLLETPTSRNLQTVGTRIPEIAIISLELPEAEELRERVTAVGRAICDGWPDAPDQLAPRTDAIARAGVGLASHHFERLLAEALVDHQLDFDAVVDFIHREKPHILGRDGLLQLTNAAHIEALAGLPTLKAWLRRRKLAMTPAATQAGIPTPRGCLLVGVQGCGKSLAARVCASELGLPLLRLEPGRLFGGTVGESEENLRRATATADRLAPVVLWIDELDKGIAGSEGSAADGGTAARVLGGLLTWLQERTRPVFVVATANRIEFLPPELLRRGRFDDIFFIDLPTAAERVAILQVHSEIRIDGQHEALSLGDRWTNFAEVAQAAEGYSGAELAAALVEARLSAFAQQRKVTAEDLRCALADSVPLSVLRREEIEALRRWAQGRARRA